MVERSPDAIRSKIQSIEQSWREAHDFVNGTGNGIMEDAMETDDPSKITEAKSSIERYVKKLCPLYYFLADIFVTQAASDCKYTSDLIDMRNYDVNSSDSEDGDDSSRRTIDTNTYGDDSSRRTIDINTSSIASASQRSSMDTSKVVVDLSKTPSQKKDAHATLADDSSKTPMRSNKKLSMHEANTVTKKARKNYIGPESTDPLVEFMSRKSEMEDKRSNWRKRKWHYSRNSLSTKKHWTNLSWLRKLIFLSREDERALG